MSIDCELPCWEIMKCDGSENCPARQQPERDCWDIASELDDYRSAFNICKDCIVYMLKQGDSVFSEQEIKNIMEEKGVCALA